MNEKDTNKLPLILLGIVGLATIGVIAIQVVNIINIAIEKHKEEPKTTRTIYAERASKYNLKVVADKKHTIGCTTVSSQEGDFITIYAAEKADCANSKKVIIGE